LLTEYDFFIGIAFYVLSVISCGYWIHYYRSNRLPFALPDDEDVISQRTELIKRRFSLSNSMWFLQCVSISLGTLFLFGYIAASIALLYNRIRCKFVSA
jgi:hypothetical protein